MTKASLNLDFGGCLKAPHAPHAPCLVILDHGLYCELSEVKRLALCELWESMILQDHKALIDSSRRLGIDPKTAELLPLYFTNRSMTTRAGLGEAITLEEKEDLKRQLVESKLLPKDGGPSNPAMAGLALLADRLPADFLMVMRTMHLVAALHRDLGGTARQRFTCYANAAVRGRCAKMGALRAWLHWYIFQVRKIGHAKKRSNWIIMGYSQSSQYARTRNNFVFVVGLHVLHFMERSRDTLLTQVRLCLKEFYLKMSRLNKATTEHFSIARSLAELAAGWA